MDPVSIIVAALLAGTAAGASTVVTGAVEDSYRALKSLLVKMFRSHQSDDPDTSAAGVDAVSVLEAYQTDPDVWGAPLRQLLAAHGAATNEQILATAQLVLDRADPDGAAIGKYQVDLRGAQGVQVGDHGRMTVTFGGANQAASSPPTEH